MQPKMSINKYSTYKTNLDMNPIGNYGAKLLAKLYLPNLETISIGMLYVYAFRIV